MQERSYLEDLPNEEHNYNNEIEQAQKLLPLANPMFELSISPRPKSLYNNNSFCPFQLEVVICSDKHDNSLILMYYILFRILLHLCLMNWTHPQRQLISDIRTTHKIQVDILISKNQALQLLYPKHRDNVYKTP